MTSQFVEHSSSTMPRRSSRLSSRKNKKSTPFTQRSRKCSLRPRSDANTSTSSQASTDILDTPPPGLLETASSMPYSSPTRRQSVASEFDEVNVSNNDPEIVEISDDDSDGQVELFSDTVDDDMDDIRSSSDLHSDSTDSSDAIDFAKPPADPVLLEIDNREIEKGYMIKKHHKSGLYVCGHQHKPKVVLPKQLKDHRRSHKCKADQKILERHLKKGAETVPKHLDTFLPLIPQSKRKYCTNCKQFLDLKEKVCGGFYCLWSHIDEVYCQNYFGTKWVIVGPIPKRVDPRDVAYFKDYSIPQVVPSTSDSYEAEQIANIIGWPEIFKGKVRSDVEPLISKFDVVDALSNFVNLTNKQRREFSMNLRIEWIIKAAFHNTNQLTSLSNAPVSGIQFSANSEYWVFCENLNLFKTVMLYTMRTYKTVDSVYFMSKGLRNAMDAMIVKLDTCLSRDGIDRLWQRNYEANYRSVHVDEEDGLEYVKLHFDEIDLAVLNALWLMVQEKIGFCFTTHPWVCAMGTWALNDRGGFRHEIFYHKFFTAMQEMGRYIYVVKAWVEMPKRPQQWLQDVNRDKTGQKDDIVSTFNHLGVLHTQVIRTSPRYFDF